MNFPYLCLQSKLQSRKYNYVIVNGFLHELPCKMVLEYFPSQFNGYSSDEEFQKKMHKLMKKFYPELACVKNNRKNKYYFCISKQGYRQQKLVNKLLKFHNKYNSRNIYVNAG